MIPWSDINWALTLGLGLPGLLLLLIIGVLLAGRLGAFSGRPPRGLGVAHSRLRPPRSTPNCVHSQAALWFDHPQHVNARIEPLALRGDGPATIARIKALIEAMPGAKVIDSRGDYLYARFQTRLLKFIDDAEFWFDPAAQVIQLRSASRLGRRDFNANRKRIEALRAQLAASPKTT